MGNNWVEVTLGDVITLQRGFDLRAQDRTNGDVPVISSSGFSGTHSEAKVIGPGVVIGRYGSIGQVFYVDRDFWPHNTTLFVKDFKGNDPLFISYLLQTIDYEAHNDKSSVPGVNRNHLHMTRVHIPRSPNEQRAIAAILGALDDKIELNRRINQTLEQMAQALFKSWFVDFDPVHANRNGEAMPGIAREVQALFPNAFEDSVLGEIPQGWRISRFEELAQVSKKSINPGDYPDEFFDHYSIPAFDNGQLPKIDVGANIKSNKFIVLPTCVLISKLNPDTPRIWFVELGSERRSISSTEFLVTLPKTPSTREFMYCLASSKQFTDSLATGVTGTSKSHQRVNSDDLLLQRIVMPSHELIQEFGNCTRPMLAHVARNKNESLTLAATRDALLPKLLSGEVRVREAEKMIEEIL